MPRAHYITKEDIQNLKRRVTEFKNFIRRQSTIARMAKVDELYKSLNVTFDDLEKAMTVKGDNLSQENLTAISKNLQTLYVSTEKFKAAVSGMQPPVNLNEPDEPEGYVAELFGQFELSQTLGALLDFARIQNSYFERIIKEEKENAQENQRLDQQLLREADERTMIKGSQEKLRGVRPHDESGYGVLYDTVTECLKIIEADNDLLTLAGEEYSNFKKTFEDWKQDVERYVRNGEFSNTENEGFVVNLYSLTERFFNSTRERTHAFDELRRLMEEECHSMQYAVLRQEGIAIKDLLNHNYPFDEPEDVSTSYEEEAVTADMSELNSTYFAKGIQQRNDMEKMQFWANNFLMNSEPYMHKGKALIGDDLRAELLKYKIFSMSEITRVGNESSPLLASLFNKGFTPEQLIKASKNPDAPENKAVIEVMKQTRKEILEIAMLDDVREADDKISSLVVATLGRLEGEIGELIKNPANENIVTFATSIFSLKSFLEQGIPKDVYMENGEPFIRGSVDRKLREAGKAYTYDHLYRIIDAFSYIAGKHKQVDDNGNMTIGGASSIANELYFAKRFLKQIAKKPTTGEAIAAVTDEFYNELTAFQADENNNNEAKHYEENKGIMKDTLYKLGFYNASKFLAQMEAQREANGASNRFLKVLHALKDVDQAQKRGFKQDYINEYFNELQAACNEYLDHRNPWKQAGEERYKLVTRIAAYVEASRPDRLVIAAEERAENRQIDTSFREINNHFLANTKPYFSDSDKMKAIKAISGEIVYCQLHGMEIPADGGDISWYKLIKTCAQYLSDPDKADNRRRDAVRELMARAIEAGHFQDPCLDLALAQSAPGAEGNRAEIMTSLTAYERARDERVRVTNAYNAAKQDIIKKEKGALDKEINRNMDIVRMYHAVENNVYVDSIFGLNPQPNPEMFKKGVYTYDEGEYHVDEIKLSDNAKRGLEALGLSEGDFANLAYMDYALNSYIYDGVNYTEKTDEAAIHVYGMMHEHVTGSNFRQSALKSLSHGGNAFRVARENMVTMLEYVGASEPTDLSQMSDLIGHMLHFLKPDLREATSLAYSGEQFYIKQVMKIAEATPGLKRAILDSGRITGPEYRLLKGITENAEIEKAAAVARLRVVSAVKSGYVMTKQEMTDCYRAIVKAGIIWTENKVLQANNSPRVAERIGDTLTELSQATIVHGNLTTQYNAQKELDPNSEATKALKVQVDAAKKEHNRLIALLDAKNKSSDVIRPILTFIGTKKDRELFDGIVESMIPENITMQDLMQKANPAYIFKKEYEALQDEITNKFEARNADLAANGNVVRPNQAPQQPNQAPQQPNQAPQQPNQAPQLPNQAP